MGGQIRRLAADQLGVTTSATYDTEDPMFLLEHGLPLTLLLDLADPAGPQSADIMRQESPDVSDGGWPQP